MKTNIVGWLYIIAAPIFLVSFVLVALQPSSSWDILVGIFSLFMGIFAIIFGSAVRRHRKWTWYVGMVMIPLVAAGNMYSLVSNLDLVISIPVAMNIFSFYALVSEKELFFINQ